MKFLSKFAVRGSQRHIGAQLERIGDLLEVILNREYGWVKQGTPEEKEGPEEDVMYVDEAKEFEREWRKKQGQSEE